jgi:hypothetical protein
MVLFRLRFVFFHHVPIDAGNDKVARIEVHAPIVPVGLHYREWSAHGRYRPVCILYRPDRRHDKRGGDHEADE